MSGSVNKVILIGNVGRDPEARELQSGKVVNFTLATSDTWTDKATGERKDRTEWHRIVVFNDRIGEVVMKFVSKGSKVYIEGSLQSRKWTDKDGQEKVTTEVVIDRFRGELTLLDTKRNTEESAGQQAWDAAPSATPARRPAVPGHRATIAKKPAINFDGDEIPY